MESAQSQSPSENNDPQASTSPVEALGIDALRNDDDDIDTNNPDGTCDNLDEVIPPHTPHSLPVVGLGGSAGAIPVLREFFSLMPPDSGFAFVVVIHLMPDMESTLPEILGAVTAIPVIAVTSPERLEANRIYVIPPSVHLSMLDGHIVPQPLVPERGRRVAIDLFFRTLADVHGTNATGIILSGADSDGIIGLKRIKERGGLSIAQDPEEAEHNAMPRAAIATGMVDWILPVREMPSRLLAHLRNEEQLRLPTEKPALDAESAQKKNVAPKAVLQEQTQQETRTRDENALREVLAFLRTRTGHDFAHYKRATILRRIGRRLQVNSLPDIPSYVEFLRGHPGEAGALLNDLLISVTNFFRDPESFHALEAEIPRIFGGKRRSDQVRVWVAGCATGEEAYSIAILLSEYADKLDSSPSLLVFATDLSDSAIHAAREGRYPLTIEADVSPERLRRFFTTDGNSYFVRRELRELVLFASHNLLRDSPFSKLDLVTCRNLLIYLNRNAQQRAFETFHFALKPEGLLFLGTSESADDVSHLFELHDKKHRLYLRRTTAGTTVPPMPLPGNRLALPPVSPSTRTSRMPAITAAGDEAPVLPADIAMQRRRTTSFSDLHLALLEKLAPPSIVINEEYEIVHLSESAGRFLQFAGGQPSTNLLRVVHPMLRLELGTALFSATQRGEDVRIFGLPYDEAGERKYVDLAIRPMPEAGGAGRGLIVVLFETTGQPEGGASEPRTEPIARQLDEELQQLKASLRATVEQYEVSVEELKASNEELQAMNEEARSTSEELETSKEELQSVNEELTTVNQELRSKVEDLSRANSDLQNLITSTDLATIFLDRELRIKRFTPRAAQLFNVIPTDLDRPLAHLTHKLDYSDLAADAELVLSRLTPIEKEVRSANGDWYAVRVLPYRTGDDRIDGVVLTLAETTERKRAEEAIAEDLRSTQILHELGARLISEENIQTIYNEITGAAMGLVRADAASLQIFDENTQELVLLTHEGIGKEIGNHYQRIGASSRTPAGIALAKNERILSDFTSTRIKDRDGSLRMYVEAGLLSGLSIPLVSRSGKPIGMVTTYWRKRHYVPSERENRFLDLLARQAADLIELRQSELALRESEERYRTLFSSMDEGYILCEVIFDDNEKPVDILYLEANPAAVRMTGRQLVGKTTRQLSANLEDQWYETWGRVAKTGVSERHEYCTEPFDVWYNFYLFKVGSPEENKVAAVYEDITERKRRELNVTLLNQIGIDLSTLSTPGEIMERVGARVGEFLRVASCVFADVDAEGNTANIFHGWLASDVPSTKQTFLLEDYLTQEFNRAERAGEVFIVHDTSNDERVKAANYTRYKIGSFITVPFHWRGRWTAFLAVTSAEPRDWRADEIELLQEISNRIFSRLERARAEEARRESEQRLSAMFTHAAVGLSEISLDGRFIRVNDELCKILGRSHDELLTLGIADVSHPDDVAPSFARVRELIENGKPVSLDKRYLRPDGTVVHANSSITLLVDEAGEPESILTVTVDLTQRKLTEEGLRESEERFRLLVEGTEDYAMFLMDKERRIIHWNMGAERVFGWSRDEAIGQAGDMIFTPEDRKTGQPDREARTAMQTGRAIDYRWHIRKDGSRFWADGVMSCLAGPGKQIRGFVKIARDMTRQRENEEALKKAHDELEARVVERTLELGQLNTELRRHAEHLQHTEAERQLLLQRLVVAQEEERKRISRELHDQMGQSLTALKVGLSNILSDDKENSVERLQILNKSIDDLTQQIHNLAWELRPAVLDNLGLETAVQQIVDNWAKQSGIAADFASRGFIRNQHLLLHVESAFYRVIQEALTNVQKHADATQVSVVLERVGNEVRAIVEDNGKGFSTYEPDGTQTPANNKTRNAQQRLGLIGMRERMDLIGGLFSVESEPGKGTTIYARAPFEQQRD